MGWRMSGRLSDAQDAMHRKLVLWRSLKFGPFFLPGGMYAPCFNLSHIQVLEAKDGSGISGRS